MGKSRKKGTGEIMDYALGFLAGMYFTILCIWTQLIVRENKRKAEKK
jgi:heme/copper-type cytochrome/quinol oxidase subunit 4